MDHIERDTGIPTKQPRTCDRCGGAADGPLCARCDAELDAQARRTRAATEALEGLDPHGRRHPAEHDKAAARLVADVEAVDPTVGDHELVMFTDRKGDGGYFVECRGQDAGLIGSGGLYWPAYGFFTAAQLRRIADVCEFVAK